MAPQHPRDPGVCKDYQALFRKNPAGAQWVKGKTVLITGGAGYLGRRLIVLLDALGAGEVRVLDRSAEPLRARLPEAIAARVVEASALEAKKSSAPVVFFGDDIRVYDVVSRAVRGAHVVFHLCSYGMSGREMMNKEMTRQVNVTGTENVIRACKEHGVEWLAYTSTANTVFNGQVIDAGRESELAVLSEFVDEYSRTKAVAETMVLGADGPTLHTVALRPNGIYGENEDRHLPRILKNVDMGLYKFRVGLPGDRVAMDWVYADNLAWAHILAVGGPKGAAHGQAFFITDNNPVSSFDIFAPVIHDIGYRDSNPQLSIPYWIMYILAFLIELVHMIIAPLIPFTPLLTRAEVNKVGVRHTFSTELASSTFGYYPVVPTEASVLRVRDWYVQHKLCPPTHWFSRRPQQQQKKE